RGPPRSRGWTCPIGHIRPAAEPGSRDRRRSASALRGARPQLGRARDVHELPGRERRHDAVLLEHAKRASRWELSHIERLLWPSATERSAALFLPPAT